MVEHTIADCEVDGSIPPRRFFLSLHFFCSMLQRRFLPLWNRRIPIIVSSLRYFGRRRFADDGIDEFVSNKVADPITDGNSTPEESQQKNADLEIQESDGQDKTESTPDFPKRETVDWNSLKSAGLGDLNTAITRSVRKELTSHVPSETVVMKYGYVRFIFSLHL